MQSMQKYSSSEELKKIQTFIKTLKIFFYLNLSQFKLDLG